MKEYMSQEDYEVYQNALATNWNGLEGLDLGVIVRMYGFKDKIEYYEYCTSARRLNKVACPLFVLMAKDDWVNPQ
jgi:predicted alpha/beta-fold hydrolase